MTLYTVFMEPAILVITICFLSFLLFTTKNYARIEKQLKKIYEYLKELNKKEVSYKFNQIDEFFVENSFTSTLWEDFKKALIFPEKFFIAQQNAKGEVPNDIYLTVDASYFFNEETLILSKINNKFIQTMPTLLTGLGPFFTFLKMALAFASVNLASAENVGESLNGLIGNIQIAALCSVFAVGFSLLFMFIEKIMYNKMCKRYYLYIQKEFIRLFDVITSEKFLIDLVKESKIQNSANEKLLKELPMNISKAISAGIGETTVPYLENILYSLNKLNESLNKGNGGDVVDKLF